MDATLQSSWLCNCPPVRNYYVVCFVVSGVKTFISSGLQRLQHVSFERTVGFRGTDQKEQ